MGAEQLLEALAGVATGPDDAPLARVRIAKCGATNHLGTHDALDEAAARETPAEAAERLARQSEETKASILEAIGEGLRAGGAHKRKAPEPAAAAAAGGASTSGAGASGSGGGAGGAAAAGAAAAGGAGGKAAAGRNVRGRTMMDALAGLSDEDDEDGSSDSGE